MFEYVVYICNFNQNLSLQFLSFRKTHRRAGLYHLTHSAPLLFLSQSPRCAQLGSHLHGSKLQSSSNYGGGQYAKYGKRF